MGNYFRWHGENCNYKNVPEGFKKTARTNEADYFERYQKSIDHPEEFWAVQANKLEWIKPFTKVKDTSFEENNFKVE